MYTLPTARPASTLAFVALAALVVGAGCRGDRRDRSPNPLTGATVTIASDGSAVRVANPAMQAQLMRTAIERHHPRVLAEGAAADTVVLWFFTNTRGEVDRTFVDTRRPLWLNPNAIVVRLQEHFPEVDARGGLRALSAHGTRTFAPGEMGPSRVIVMWVERKVEGPPADLFRFSIEADPGG